MQPSCPLRIEQHFRGRAWRHKSYVAVPRGGVRTKYVAFARHWLEATESPRRGEKGSSVNHATIILEVDDERSETSSLASFCIFLRHLEVFRVVCAARCIHYIRLRCSRELQICAAPLVRVDTLAGGACLCVCWIGSWKSLSTVYGFSAMPLP